MCRFCDAAHPVCGVRGCTDRAETCDSGIHFCDVHTGDLALRLMAQLGRAEAVRIGDAS